MPGTREIQNALISVYDKSGLEAIIRRLGELGVHIYSTGGTAEYISGLGVEVHQVEDLTGYPSILGGRVKTLHPKVFGGILCRRNEESDMRETGNYEIPLLDLVIVDLYPFEATVASGAPESEIIEKIDIGGISLIRAAAKNFNDVLIVSSASQYSRLSSILEKGGVSSLEDRREFALEAFAHSSSYDSAIFSYFQGERQLALRLNINESMPLRYGENPHQKGWFFGSLEAILKQVHGKEVSYNNLLDIDAAVQLMAEFEGDEPTFAILKHTNACGVAQRSTIGLAYAAALECDPVSAFGGVLIANRDIDPGTAASINDLFCEVLIAPGFHPDTVELLMSKKNRILMIRKPARLPEKTYRSVLNGILVQERDIRTEQTSEFQQVTVKGAEEHELADLSFAMKIAKHTKSNTIVLAKNKQLMASGTGQTSRVDALKQAIEKAGQSGFNLEGSVMASDAFFPFPDCVEIAHASGIRSVIQPGGSIKDRDSIDYCDAHGLSMYFTGVRHFRH